MERLSKKLFKGTSVFIVVAMLAAFCGCFDDKTNGFKSDALDTLPFAVETSDTPDTPDTIETNETAASDTTRTDEIRTKKKVNTASTAKMYGVSPTVETTSRVELIEDEIKVVAERRNSSKSTSSDAKSDTSSVIPKKEIPKVEKITVNNVKVEAVSVSCLKISWTAETNRDYELSVDTEAPYQENIHFIPKEKGLYYITGLRENSEYEVTVTPILTESEKNKNIEAVEVTEVGTTFSVEVIEEFEHEDGWTSCFAGERASGLTGMPSSGAIYGSSVDTITDTGIRRFPNGDYCCAMGEWYGECNDRFLIELDNGIQFTVRICDSKGWADDADGDGIPDGRFHWFGGTGNGKCVIEFVYDDANLPSCVAFSGSWGYYNWNGLNLGSNIKSVKKLASW